MTDWATALGSGYNGCTVYGMYQAYGSGHLDGVYRENGFTF